MRFWSKSTEPYVEPDSGYRRLEDQIRWYDKKSGMAQRSYKTGKFLVIVGAALIPIASLLDWKITTALLGGFVAVCEGIQHLNQWQHNWITYRSTCEALRHEKYTFIEKADPYNDLAPDDARRLLVERTESLISTEHSKWIASNERAADTAPRAERRSTRSPN
jgi:hypothetical protein